MCLIIKRPAGRIIPDEFLAEAWRKNSDGWGMGFLSTGVLVTCRGMTLDELLAANQNLPADCEVIVHLRKATVGDVNLRMTHPFWVRPSLILFHNGTINSSVPLPEGKSDSWSLARTIRARLAGMNREQSAGFVRSDAFAREANEIVGGSMAVLFDHRGVVAFGRHWHTVGAREWCPEMAGMKVSNVTAWSPKR